MKKTAGATGRPSAKVMEERMESAIVLKLAIKRTRDFSLFSHNNNAGKAQFLN